MDKRSLLFVVCVSVALFIVNAFFSFQGDDQKRKQLQQQEVRKEQKLAALKVDVEKRTATLSDLNLLDLFSNEEVVTSGVRVSNGVLTLAWTEELPDFVFVDGERFVLAEKPVGLGDPVLYLSSEGGELEVPLLSSGGRVDLQLVKFNVEEKSSIVRLGEWTHQKLTIPIYHTLSGNALAFVKEKKGYRPVGVYEVTGKNFIPLNKFQGMKGYIKEQKKLFVEQDSQGQRYYVLENETMQLVFSNVGGGISEINLPFKSEEHPNSVVLPVALDKDMESEFPYNDKYPAYPYYSSDGTFIEKVEVGGYFPLLRRDIFNSDGRVVSKIAPKHYAFNVISEYPEVANLTYSVKEYDKEHIVFEATQEQRRITKTFTLPKESEELPYLFDVSVLVEGDNRGLWLNSGIPSVDLMSENVTSQLKYRMLKDGKVEVKGIDLPKDSVRVGSGQPIWLSNATGFFGLIMNPISQEKSTSFGPMGFRVSRVSGIEVPPRLILVDSEYQRYSAKDYPAYEVQLPLVEAESPITFRMYSGPYNLPTLKKVDEVIERMTGEDPGFVQSQSFQGWFSFISEPFAKFLLVLMKFFHKITNSWAVSIILLTVALRVMLFPLNSWSMKSMKRMQKISPKVQEIQKKYKKEPKKAQIEVMGLYRQYGVNPLGGCFPLLIQMPFLIGMFDLLRSTFQLRGAIFIPGWIDNLSAPDILFSWNYPIPFIGTSFHLLPVLLGVVMFFQQKMTSSLPKDRSLWTDQQRQQKAMGGIMTVVFTVLFYKFPSGLNLYWLSSMVLGIVQQWYINKRLDKLPLEPKKPSKKGGKGAGWAKRLENLSR